MTSPREAATVELTLANVGDYLRERNLVDGTQDVKLELLAGGISNTVVMVVLATDCFVVKQSLPKLRVDQDWFFDRRRIFVETDCMATLGHLLPPGCVPKVRFSDRDNFVLGMSCAPDGGKTWKQSLLAGTVDLEAADRAGRLLGLLHCKSYQRPDLRDRFGDQNLLIQGRVDPYHRVIASLYPDLASTINAEIERMLGTQIVLVHGDYSPKNIVVYPNYVLVLDFEVAHYGDPAFDVAFCLTHLVLKAAHFARRHVEYLASARRFWGAYKDAVKDTIQTPLEASVVGELGCLLLARIDGKSRAEYINDDPTRDFVRNMAREILLTASKDPDSVIDWLGNEMRQRLS